jgi:FAD/FMN-containing dehydrogenase
MPSIMTADEPCWMACARRGRAHVLTDGDLAPGSRTGARRSHGQALAVVRPASTEEVAGRAPVRRMQAATGVSIVPQGGNTGMVVGSTPDAIRAARSC